MDALAGSFTHWTAAFDSNIALTISRGASAPNLTGASNLSRVFVLFNGDCEELFRVWYNNGALNGDGVQPQGVITAYRVTHGGPTWWENDLDESNVDMPEFSDTVAYRTDCPIYQPI